MTFVPNFIKICLSFNNLRKTHTVHTYGDFASFPPHPTGKVAVNVMKSYRGSRDIAPFVLNLWGIWRRVVSFTPHLLYPQKEPTVTIE
jgi:hypothetical protein